MADEVEQKNKILFPLNSPIAVETSDVFGIEAFSFFNELGQGLKRETRDVVLSISYCRELLW